MDVRPPPPVTLGRLLLLAATVLRDDGEEPPFDPAAVLERERRRRERATYIATEYAPRIRPHWLESGYGPTPGSQTATGPPGAPAGE